MILWAILLASASINKSLFLDVTSASQEDPFLLLLPEVLGHSLQDQLLLQGRPSGLTRGDREDLGVGRCTLVQL